MSQANRLKRKLLFSIFSFWPEREHMQSGGVRERRTQGGGVRRGQAIGCGHTVMGADRRLIKREK